MLAFHYALTSAPATFASSTLVRMLNAGETAGAADQFLRWNHTNGQVLEGLTRRREAQRSLFLMPDKVSVVS
jgi:lysozyme